MIYLRTLVLALQCLVTADTHAALPGAVCADVLAELADADIRSDANTRWLHGQRPQLHTWEPVEAIAKVLGLQKPADKLMAWVTYLDHSFQNDQAKAQHRKEYLDAHTLRPEDVPESHFELQRRIAREAGHGNIQLTPQIKKELSEAVTQNQRESLGSWFDYLTSEDTKHYTPWLRAFVLSEVVKLGKLNPDTKKFTRRDKNQVAPFPELNREALARVMARLEELAKQGSRNTFSFAAEYGHELSQAVASRGNLAVTDGIWVKYSKGSDPKLLAKALEGWNTGWCTAECRTAEMQLKAGDFYIYCSQDAQGLPKVPRLAIRMEDTKIAEVRGIANAQHLDSHIAATPILDRKLAEFGGEGALYRKRADHMRRLTEIEARVARSENLTGSQVAFLYGIDGPIEGFGYQKDPRVKEILDKRIGIARQDLAAVLAYFAGGRNGIAEIAKALEAKGITDAKALDILKQRTPRKFVTRNLSEVYEALRFVAGTSIEGDLRQALANAYVKSQEASPARFAGEVARGLAHSDESTVRFMRDVLEASHGRIEATPQLVTIREIELLSQTLMASHREAAEKWLSEPIKSVEQKAEYLRTRVMTADFEKLEASLPRNQRQAVIDAIDKKSNALLFRKLALERGIPREALSGIHPESFEFESFQFEAGFFRGGKKVRLGSPADEPGRYGNEENQRNVTFKKPFSMGATQVTQLQWVLVTGEPNPSHLKDGPGAIEVTLPDGSKTKVLPNHPVEQVSHDDFAKKYYPALSKLDPKNNYRFPKEAEWEYAARGGTATPWSSGSTETKLGEWGWYSVNADGATHAVAELKPNRFGLYDMHGNVWEWCGDWYTGDVSQLGGVDPTGPKSGSGRVLRGGSWSGDARRLRSASRNSLPPRNLSTNVGGRPVRTPK